MTMMNGRRNERYRPAGSAITFAVALVLAGCGAGTSGTTGPPQPASRTPPTSVPTPSALPTMMPAEKLVDSLLSDWNAGSQANVSADYDRQAHLMLVGDDGDVTSYATPVEIRSALVSRAADGFSIVRTGDILDLGHGRYLAFAATWTSDRTYTSGNAVVLLELNQDGLVLAQYVIGASEEPASAQPAPAELTTRVDEAVDRHNHGDASEVVALFTPDARARVGYDRLRVGWTDLWQRTCDSIEEIQAFTAETAASTVWRPHRIMDVVQQGSLVIYPISLGSKGFEFWVLRLADGSGQFDYWWDIGGA